MFSGIELVTEGRERKEKTQLCFFLLSSIKIHRKQNKMCQASKLVNQLLRDHLFKYVKNAKTVEEKIMGKIFRYLEKIKYTFNL